MDEDIIAREQAERNRLEPPDRANQPAVNSERRPGSDEGEASLVTSSPTGKEESVRAGSKISAEEALAIRERALEILRKESPPPADATEGKVHLLTSVATTPQPEV